MFISEGWIVKWRSLPLPLLLSFSGLVLGQVHYSISEELKLGTPIGNIADDLGIDVDKLTARNLRIMSRARKPYFQVNMEDGVLYVNDKIDREELCVKSSTCWINVEVVVDNPLELHRVKIEIIDINDNSPTFPESRIFLEIAESSLQGARFPLKSAYDADEGTNSLHKYELSPNDYFLLDVQTNNGHNKSPELVLKKSLDREHQPSHNLILTAFDGGDPQKYGTASITVIIQDVNDNPPVFDQAIYKVRLKENTPNGTLVIKLNATDLDKGQNGEIFYSFSSLVPNHLRKLFNIKPNTGEILVLEAFDFEESNTYEIHVQAKDKGQVPMIGHCKVLVEIIDINDNYPEVTVASLSSPIKEDILPGSVIALITVADRDFGVNGQVHCHISETLLFQLKSNFLNYYSLILNKPLDREKNSEYNITITATDFGSPPLSTNRTIRIQVSDVNDNSPSFLEPSYTVSITENNVPGCQIFTVSALDPDLDQNARIKYTILETSVLDMLIFSYISVKSDSGVIYAMQSFDHEKINFLKFQVKAEDNGLPSLSSNVTVYVLILDQNDNAPTILLPYSSKSPLLTEMVPRIADAGYLVTKVKAIDHDSGYNAWLSYQLAQESVTSPFSVEQYTGEIRTKCPIVDTDDKQLLIIAVMDHGAPSLTTTVTLTISITEKAQELSYISDYRQLSKIVDPVSDLNLYLIVAIISIFIIFFLTIITYITLKYHETHSSVSRYGKPIVYGECESWKFSQSHRYNLSLTMGACDNDLMGLKQQLHNHSSNSAINGPNVAEDTMDLRNNGSECMGATSECLFRITMITTGSWRLKWRSLYLMLLLCIKELVQGQIRYRISEELQFGTFVGNIANDLGIDAKTLTTRMFRIVSGSRKQFFQVNMENGILFINEKIDREELCAQSSKCLLNLEVVVNSPLELFRLEVEIVDINDNSPDFPESNISFAISESTLPGARFPLEGAYDSDEGTNSLRTYELSQNDYFVLDVQTNNDKTKSPELVLKKSLDREQQSSHHLILTAVDGGHPERCGTVFITIIVHDANDNSPVFDQSVYRVSLIENAPEGTLVVKLNATDLDTGSNGEIFYSISTHTPGNAWDCFNIERNTGEIRVKRAVDFEESATFEIRVQASDNGQLPMTGYCKVLVEVIDMNDNLPEVILTSLSSPVKEDTLPGSVIALITVTDKDSGLNGEVHCYVSETLPFHLKSNFLNYYSLTLSKPLDRERISEYNITIRATDSGSPPLSTAKTIMVQVSDVNDNAPRFTKLLYTISITENNIPGSPVFTMSAMDPDADENATIKYTIVETSVLNVPISTYISINSESGVIYAMQSFDHENIKLFHFKVKAEDNGFPSLSSNVTVHIFVIDQNDNAPIILTPFSSSGSPLPEIIPRNTNAGYLLAKIRAIDQDSGYNAWLSYQLREQSQASLYSIELYTGEIRTRRALVDTDYNELLIITVKDHGKPPLTTTVTLTVSVAEKTQERSRLSDSRKQSKRDDPVSNTNLYLIVSIVSISIIFLLTIVTYVALKYHDAESSMSGRRKPVVNGDFESWTYPQSHCCNWSLTKETCNNDVARLKPQHQNLLRNSLLKEAVDSEKQLKELENILIESNLHIYYMVAFAMAQSYRHTAVKWQLLHFVLLHSTLDLGCGQISYSVPEELEPGTALGYVAQDLGLDIKEINFRTFRMFFATTKQYFKVNMESGLMFLSERIDREEVCASSLFCTINLQVVVDKPLAMYGVEVEITDINDNSPSFPENELQLTISELTLPKSRFPLETAQDADVGMNSVQIYKLNPNEYFALDVQKNGDQSFTVELVLEKLLDRETISFHQLVLTAIDGGNPERSGTLQILINVLDVNDNSPIFEHPIYNVRLFENAAPGSLVIATKATDLDEGHNGEIVYSLSSSATNVLGNLFSIERETGQLIVKGELDFETAQSYEIRVEASDKGSSPFVGHCKVLVEVLDINDNSPQITVTSLSSPIPENAPTGTLIALFTMSDRDSGVNGKINCYISQNIPFKIEANYKNYYSLVLNEQIDRESIAQYRVTIIAIDGGSPSLSTTEIILVEVSDVNDNAPTFSKPFYTVFVKENNVPGSLIFTLSASDPDLNENGLLTYTILEKIIMDAPISSWVSIKPNCGSIYTLKSFDYEHLKLFQFEVEAEDAGSPSLNSSATVSIFILDENDNAPAILAPHHNDGSSVTENMPRTAKVGHFVTKIRAVDFDSGHNAWLSYQLLHPIVAPIFSAGLYTGEIRTVRPLRDEDKNEQELVILVTDHGKIPQSSTLSLTISIVDEVQETTSDFRKLYKNSESFSDINFYLIIAITFITIIFLLTIIIFTFVRYQKSQNSRNNYGRPSSCGNTGRSWTYSQSHGYQLYFKADTSKGDLTALNSQFPHTSEKPMLNNGTIIRENIFQVPNNANTFNKTPMETLSIASGIIDVDTDEEN
nr:PREDICTED: uncharacterized protein LOC102358535 [Latimeria chalumnae]|eukprot:XP_014350998.1 PREDICTED: uncharacterized protein LOC102358535 [Latimeria chalumnae]